MFLGIYDYKGKRKKGSYYNLNNIADFYKKEIACFYCNSTDDLERDHVRPLWAGGNDKLENLQILCRICHQQKTEEEKDKEQMLEFIISHQEVFLQ
ncbi:HNH endonuclease [Candidatus Pacearchaeota archaeon]|nr:HNH endonuclease [Candidatus Pacearchaeota archaeon]